MPPYRLYSVTMEILSFPFLFVGKFPSMCTHFAAVSFDARNHWCVQSPIGDIHHFCFPATFNVTFTATFIATFDS